MKTGIFIRGQVDGKWGNYDIGDPQLPDSQVLNWLQENAIRTAFTINLIMAILDRQWRYGQAQKEVDSLWGDT